MAELEDRAVAGRRPSALVAYATRGGSTRGVAERIAAALEQDGAAVDLRRAGDARFGALDSYDAVVLGSPVYDQSWLPEATAFVHDHAAALAARPVWLFSVGSFGDSGALLGRVVRREPRDIGALRASLRARDYRVFAGVVQREGWPLPSRLLFGLLGGRFGDRRDWQAIDAWAHGIGWALRASADADSRVAHGSP